MILNHPATNSNHNNSLLNLLLLPLMYPPSSLPFLSELNLAQNEMTPHYHLDKQDPRNSDIKILSANRPCKQELISNCTKTIKKTKLTPTIP